MSVVLACAGAVGPDIDDTARRLLELLRRTIASGLLWETAEDVARRLKADRLSDAAGVV